MVRSTALASLLALSAAGGVLAAPGAEELMPGHAHVLRLGEVSSAVSYFTVDRDGSFRVVATVGSDVEGAPPVRAVATLLPGQSLVVSTPGLAGQPAAELVLVRVGETLRLGAQPNPAGARY